MSILFHTNKQYILTEYIDQEKENLLLLREFEFVYLSKIGSEWD